MPTQSQFDTTLDRNRRIDCKLFVLNYDYTTLDEISGKIENVSFNIDAESDIRRTANIEMTLTDIANQQQSNEFYWVVGNPYWFDKYIQIYTSVNDVWVNEGIYCINAPSITYNATSNRLSFQAVDLMAKLTGMRNGYLEGMTYSVPVGSTITGAIEGLLLEQGFTKYILYDPPQQTTPQDINIDIGGTAYDLLCELRDINANWETFFDVDGVFHFQQIPSGKVVTDPTSGELGEPTPVVDDTMWEKLNVEYTLDTNFEDVKNCVEVLGKTHEPDEVLTASINNHVLTLTLSGSINNYYGNEWVFSCGISIDENNVEPIPLADKITQIVVKDLTNQSVGTISLIDEPIIAGNQYYCIKMVCGASSVDELFYLGFLQPHAVAIENNPESPFYIGTSTQYTCGTMNDVDYASEKEVVITDVVTNVTGNTMSLNITPWVSYSVFSSASIGDEWKFRLHVNLDNNEPISIMQINIANIQGSYAITNASNEYITLDYSQDYMLVAQKVSSTSVKFIVYYYPTPASALPMSTTSVINLPKFDHQVRYVCAGDEYDNIYSNTLAEQRARYEIYLRSRLHDSIHISCVPIYWLDVNTIIEYTLPNNDSGVADLWLVKSISTDMSVTGTQTIDAIRYYPLYADITLENLATQEIN